MTNWYFPSNDHGENKGINDSGVATFRGTPLKSLAREICQNSLDAAIENETVRVDFSDFTIETSKLPGVSILSNTFQKCINYWNGQASKDTEKYFKNALDKIQSDKINILRISDFNTKGLTGSKDLQNINTDWMRLTKSSGSSDKKGSAGGSFGIGKFAPFACSNFSTVFYSTYDIDNVYAYQGISRLVTFERDDHETTQGVGYYGNNYSDPVNEPFYLDPNFTRKNNEYGTDIYIIGYKYSFQNQNDDYKGEIIKSILDSFLGAIWNEKLIVNIDSIEIKKSTLSQIIEEYSYILEDTFVTEYYKVLTSNETKWFETNHLNLGTIKLGYLLSDDTLHRRVAMIRKTGMKIKDANRINSFVPFSGVMFIEGDKINQRLRLLENPEHTEWQPDRSSDPLSAKRLIKSLNDFMKSKLHELIGQDTKNEIDAVGIAAFLPEISDLSDNKSKNESVSEDILEINKKIISHKLDNKISTTNSENDESKSPANPIFGNGDLDYPHDDGKTNKNSNTKQPSPSDYTSGNKSSANIAKEIKPSKFLYLCKNPEHGEYMINFVPSITANNGSLSLFLSGETDAYKAKLISAKEIGGENLNIVGNQITGLNFVKDKDLRIILKLDYSDYCSMEVKAYVNTK